MRRRTSAGAGRPESSTDLIDRVAAEQGSSAVSASGRHRLPAHHTDAVVTRDPLPSNSSLTRRLAPLAVGAAVMLVATTVAALAQPADETPLAAPELSSAVIRSEPAAPPSAPATEPAAAPSSEPAPQAAAADADEEPDEKPAEQSDGKSGEKAGTKASESEGSGKSEKSEKATASGSGGDGRQAAAAHGWTHVGGDEFNGGMSPQWTVYEGEGHAGNGRRTEEAISVEDGMLVIRGDSEGNTGGMSWKEDQRFGRWEMRARFPKGDDQYHPVLILWPDKGSSGDGETDFAETTSASDKVSFFLHYGDEQEYAHKTLDITQWHNYAVEWVDGRMTGYIDGEKWFESTDEKTLPPGKLHPTIQLDYFPEGGSPEPTELHVDYMRIYE
ncbi:glycoside hydrolase family 16 protein [Pseudonocardia sichuanensis]